MKQTIKEKIRQRHRGNIGVQSEGSPRFPSRKQYFTHQRWNLNGKKTVIS